MHHVLDRARAFHRDIMPVANEAIQPFESPPEQRTGEEESAPEARIASHHARASAPVRQGIDRHDKTEPERKKRVSLNALEARIPRPRERPPSNRPAEGNPAPPWEIWR